MGRITVDQRLSDVLNLLCEEDHIDPVTLEAKGQSLRLHSGNERDIRSLRETITYLKDYAKLQTLAKSISDSESLAKNIEEAKEYFAGLIEERKAQIATVPKPKRRNGSSYIYDYADRFKEAEERRLEAEREERARKIASLKEDIRIYQEKIKKLDQMKKALGNPQKVMEILLPEEYTNVRDNYARLVNLCATSMLEGFKTSDLVGEDKPFNYEDGQYTVNYNQARKFLSVLKAKKQVIDATDFLGKKQEYIETAGERRKTQDLVNRLKEALEETDTTNFEYMLARMNNISSQYMSLEEMEGKARRGTIFSRARDGLRVAFGLRPIGAKIPRKVWDARYELSDDIKALVSEIKYNPELEKSFKAYQLATTLDSSGRAKSLQEFAWTADQLVQYGVERVSFEPEALVVDQIKDSLSTELGYATRNLKLQRHDEEDAKHSALDTYASLTKRTKSVLGKQSKETIRNIAEEYYGLGRDTSLRREAKRQGRISPSTAAIILESIIGRKNITWEQIAASYANILGKENVNLEELDLEKAIDNKVDELRDFFSSEPVRQEEAER